MMMMMMIIIHLFMILIAGAYASLLWAARLVPFYGPKETRVVRRILIIIIIINLFMMIGLRGLGLTCETLFMCSVLAGW